MALVLVVVDDFASYQRGMIISDPDAIARVRTSEYAGQVVMVSDTIIPPPVPPSTPNYDEVLANYRTLVAQIADQQAALNAATQLNAQQNVTLAAQGQRIDSLTTTVAVLSAQISNPNGGVPVAPNLADDLPLAEDDGVVLVTNSGMVLVGDAR